MPTYPSGYYNRFDPSKNYDEHLFRAGKVLQSAELNEIQTSAANRIKNISDVLFKDGSVIRNAQIVVNADTGATILEGGAVYLAGAVRGVPEAELVIPTSGTINVGVYLQSTVVTELEDPALRDPAIGVRNYQEPGASRLKVEPAWGYNGDGQDGEFYPVYEVVNGIVSPKEPPPAIDAIALAISRYDRQSSGGFYAVSGLNTQRLADVDGKQIYSVSEGVARVAGREVTLQHAIRVEYATAPDPKTVTLEPHVALGGTERVELNHGPIIAVQQVSITKEKTLSVSHGNFTGASDPLADSPVVQIVEVKQGGTTYVYGTDYKLTDDNVDWSLTGAEPSPGSTYTVKYRYIATVTPVDLDDTGFTVSNAVEGTLIQTTYQWAMPRIDRLCLDSDGTPVWVKGVSSPYTPRSPDVPNELLGIATVRQRWDANTQVIVDAIKVVPMNELNGMNQKIDKLFALMAEERLILNATLSDPTAKRGVFSDAFYDDDLRDQGREQSAAIFSQQLTLASDAEVYSQKLSGVKTLDARVIVENTVIVGTNEAVIEQTLRTGNMKINPYDAFSPLPGVAILAPAVDFWTDIQTNWTSPQTKFLDEVAWTNGDQAEYWMNQYWANYGNYKGAGYTFQWWIDIHTVVVRNEVIRKAEVEKLGEKYVDLQNLRQIPVNFNITGFGGGELLNRVVFDGRDVAFTAP